jgi:hypothetical protein
LDGFSAVPHTPVLRHSILPNNSLYLNRSLRARSPPINLTDCSWRRNRHGACRLFLGQSGLAAALTVNFFNRGTFFSSTRLQESRYKRVA